MDRLDKAIIMHLKQDGRMSWTRLGEQVNLSASACQRRVEALLAAGVIENFTLSTNPAAVGLGVKAMVSVNVERADTQKSESFRQALLSHPRVQSAYMVSGAIDFMLEVHASDLADLARFLDEELLKMTAVRDATSSIVLRTIKAHEAMVG